MFFIVLILLTALLMEGIGTYVSIVGFGMTFHHDWVIMAVAAVLDAAKLVTVSFLYQYWEELRRKFMTKVMIVASVLLMLITSAGVYGYLVKNFQEATQGNLETSIELKTINLEIDQLQADVNTWTKQKATINKQIEQLPADDVRARERLMWSFRNELAMANKNLTAAQAELKTKLTKRVSLQKEEVKREVALGPVAYTAKVFDVSYEAAVNWLILMIVFVFDPLAVMLVLSANFLIKRREAPGLQDLKNSMRAAAGPQPATITTTAPNDGKFTWVYKPVEGQPGAVVPVPSGPDFTGTAVVPPATAGTVYTIPGPYAPIMPIEEGHLGVTLPHVEEPPDSGSITIGAAEPKK